MRMMKALYYKAAGRENASITEIPYPSLGDDDVIIKVMACGICKWAELNHDTVGGGGTLAKYPVVVGHEFAGYVEEIGKNVNNVKVGDRVTVDNAIPCGKCYACQHNDTLHCESFGSMGHNINGGFAQYTCAPEAKVFKIPDNVSFDEATVTEPVACAVHGMDVLDVKQGENILVSGMGPHGLILAQLAHFSNAQKIAAIGLVDSRLQILRDQGVPTILADRNDMSVQEAAIEKMFPNGVDAIIDTSGSWQTVKSMWKFLKKGGRFLQYGSYHQKMDMGITSDMLNSLHFKEQTYTSCSAQTFCFPIALDYMGSGKVKVDKIVTHTFSLDDYFLALDTNKNDKSTLKVVIHPNEDI
ncbi:MAG: alcohol dehydrogenase catalytic domain-containing protein [Suipraeoptans sp.]